MASTAEVDAAAKIAAEEIEARLDLFRDIFPSFDRQNPGDWLVTRFVHYFDDPGKFNQALDLLAEGRHDEVRRMLAEASGVSPIDATGTLRDVYNLIDSYQLAWERDQLQKLLDSGAAGAEVEASARKFYDAIERTKSYWGNETRYSAFLALGDEVVRHAQLYSEIAASGRGTEKPGTQGTVEAPIAQGPVGGGKPGSGTSTTGKPSDDKPGTSGGTPSKPSGPPTASGSDQPPVASSPGRPSGPPSGRPSGLPSGGPGIRGGGFGGGGFGGGFTGGDCPDCFCSDGQCRGGFWTDDGHCWVIRNPGGASGSVSWICDGVFLVGTGGRGQCSIIDGSPALFDVPVAACEPIPDVALAGDCVGCSDCASCQLCAECLTCTDCIVLLNPEENQGPVQYIAGGQVGVLQTGEMVSLGQSSVVVRFDRGGPLGEARYTLSPGSYKFAVSDRGWELFRTSFRVTLDNSANAQPFNVQMGGRNVVVAANGTEAHVSDYPILAAFDDGSGSTPAQKHLHHGSTYTIGIDSQSGRWDLFDGDAVTTGARPMAAKPQPGSAKSQAAGVRSTTREARHKAHERRQPRATASVKGK